MENLNLIRKIAWSFHSTTGLDWDDLFQEAALAYFEALNQYDPSRGKITTFMWYTITNHLKNYLKKQQKWNGNIVSIDEVKNQSTVDNLLFESLSRDAGQIAKVVLSSPKTFTGMPTDIARRHVTRVMIRRGWSWRRVWCGIRDLKLAFSN